MRELINAIQLVSLGTDELLERSDKNTWVNHPIKWDRVVILLINSSYGNRDIFSGGVVHIIPRMQTLPYQKLKDEI